MVFIIYAILYKKRKHMSSGTNIRRRRRRRRRRNKKYFFKPINDLCRFIISYNDYND